jgi:hypothetical protein
MTGVEITWYLKASKIGIDTKNNYSKYDIGDENNLICTSHIDDIIECLKEMKYNIQNYEFINHHAHCAKWLILFDVDDYEKFENKNFTRLVNFTIGKYITSSIYVKHISEYNENSNDDENDDEWVKIYKKK